MENQKTKIISIVALVALALTVVTATYAYFQAQTGEGSQTDIKINANTVDTFTFETGSAINLSLDQTSFASGAGNQTGSTYASAKLTANNKTNSATNNYNLYLNISDNNFSYTQSTSYPEILLTIKDASNNEITSISGLEYKTVTDGKGTTIKGFDITTKTGLITLLSNREITTTSTKTDTWNITATFVNYNVDQSKNAGKSFSGQVLISKDSFDDYTPNTINTLSATKSGTNLTVNLNVEQGSNEIDKYYYAIEESNGIAMLNNNANKVQRLSNKLAANTLTYVESTSSSHTFTNLNSSKDYKVSAYVVDKKKLKSNTYEYNYYSDNYVYPVINKIETSTTSDSITVKVTTTKGTNNISKYYYSIDGGNTFVESTSNSYTFSSLTKNTSYKIVIKVMDSNNKYSNVFVTSSKTSNSVTLASYVKSLYTGTQGANNVYYHNSSLANGAGDNSYRYAGANPNNYVCFGSNASTCPTDNLYRIIGVFGGQVKLIKYDYAPKTLLGTDGDYSMTYSEASVTSSSNTSRNGLNNKTIIGVYYWNKATGTNTWSESNLNKINLNTNFISNIGEEWSSKIATTTWKVGGNTWANIGTSVPATAYQNEVVHPVMTDTTDNKTEYTAKIGLMYVSDYYYAASPSAWTLVGWNSSDKTKDYRAAITINWMAMDLEADWTISPYTDDSGYSYSTTLDGRVIMGSVGGNGALLPKGAAVRPTFYLNSSIKYLNGDGSISSPIRISA